MNEWADRNEGQGNDDNSSEAIHVHLCFSWGNDNIIVIQIHISPASLFLSTTIKLSEMGA